MIEFHLFSQRISYFKRILQVRSAVIAPPWFPSNLIFSCLRVRSNAGEVMENSIRVSNEIELTQHLPYLINVVFTSGMWLISLVISDRDPYFGTRTRIEAESNAQATGNFDGRGPTFDRVGRVGEPIFREARSRGWRLARPQRRPDRGGSRPAGNPGNGSRPLRTR